MIFISRLTKIKFFIKSHGLIVLISLFLCIDSAVSKKNRLDYFTDRHWDQGKAEFQVYEGKFELDGIPRKSHHKIIIEKDKYDLEKEVMTKRKGKEVIKYNYIRSIESGIYNYNQMITVIFNKKTGKILKYSMSSQDGQGTSWMQYLKKKNTGYLVFNSYFDNEGISKYRINEKNPVFMDALPVYIRFLIGKTNEIDLKLLPSFISNKTVKPRTIQAKLIIKKEDKFFIGKKIIPNVHKAELWQGAKKTLYIFSQKYPYELIYFKDLNGDEFVLKKSAFIKMQKYTKPGKHKLIEKRR